MWAANPRNFTRGAQSHAVPRVSKGSAGASAPRRHQGIGDLDAIGLGKTPQGLSARTGQTHAVVAQHLSHQYLQRVPTPMLSASVIWMLAMLSRRHSG